MHFQKRKVKQATQLRQRFTAAITLDGDANNIWFSKQYSAQNET
jgi:hypothetical protein